MDLLQTMSGGFDHDGANGDAHIVVVNELEGIVEEIALAGTIEEITELSGTIEG